MSVERIAPEVVLALGAVSTLIAALFLPRSKQGWCAPLAIAVLVIAAAAACYRQLGTPAELVFSNSFAIDGITAWGNHTILATTGLVAVLSPRWFHTDRRHGEWYAVLLLAALGAMLMVGAADLSELMVSVLLSSATGYTMASYHRASRHSAEAGAKFYFLGALANPMLFLGIVVLYGIAGTTRYDGLLTTFSGATINPLAWALGLVLLWIGLAFKLGAFPVHPWVPDVAQGAPVPAATFLTIVPKVGALIALVRFLSLLPDRDIAWRPLIALVSALTMTIGNLAALWQDDVRRLLGWSSVSQAGYGLLAVVAIERSSLDRPALVLFLVGYASANATAFSIAAALRGRTQREAYRGLARVRPLYAVAMTIALLSLMGLPPLVGFTAKLTLFGAAIEAGYAWLAIVAVLNTVVSLFYYLRVIGPMFFRRATGPVAELGREARTLVVVSTSLVVAGGVAAEWLSDSATATSLLP